MKKVLTNINLTNVTFNKYFLFHTKVSKYTSIQNKNKYCKFKNCKNIVSENVFNLEFIAIDLMYKLNRK